MIAIPLLLVWVAYSAGFWGVSLLKGWNLSLKEIVSPTGYYTGKWPPAQAGNAVIIPDGTQASLTDISLPAPSTSTGTSNTGGSGKGGNGGGGGSNPPPGVNSKNALSKAAAQFGWNSGSNWSSLLNIVSRESGGNPNAYNATGTCGGGNHAYGIAQACGHATGAEAGCGHNAYGGYGLSASQAHAANCGNAWYQAIWMMRYIKQTYGDPDKAWAFWQAHNGY